MEQSLAEYQGTEEGAMSILDHPDDQFLQQFLLEPQMQSGDTNLEELPLLSKKVKPIPGFCLKTKTSDDQKVFINVCHSDELPAPPEVSDEALLKIIEAEDPSKFSIPLSLGEPHAEMDHGGKGCTAYDVIVNSKFLELTENRPVLKNFLLTVILEGLEQKFNMLLSRDCKILKNKKFMGLAEEQNVRRKSKPSIVECEKSKEYEAPKQKPLITELDESNRSTAEKPLFKIIREPAEGDVQYLVMELQLPKLTSNKLAKLEVGEDRILFHAHPDLYHLDIDIPYYVNNDDVGAQFNKDTKILTVTIPVKCAAPF